MKFLADQDVYAATAEFLRGLGHDVVAASDLGLSQAEDSELLDVAHDDDRVIVTRDRDYGALVFLHGSWPGAGSRLFAHSPVNSERHPC